MTSLMFLTIPIAAQTLVNFIAFGHLVRPVVTLSIIVFTLIVCAGALSIWHTILIEIIQQKLIVHVAFRLTRHFSNVSQTILATQHGPELVNQFFEISSIMKSLSNLLMYGINTGLQIFFSLILLVLYHPFFLLFDVFVILCLCLIIYIPYRTAQITAEEECSRKHAIAKWFDEILLNRFLFKFRHYPDYVIEQTDERLAGYLIARNRHFKQIIKHQIGFYGLGAIASSLLLGLGGYLVIINQLSLGQLVASEIIMSAILYALKQLSSLLEDYYDLTTSTQKIDHILSLPLECAVPLPNEIVFFVQQLNYIHLAWSHPSRINASPKKPLLIYSMQRERIQTMMTALIGLVPDLSENITLNGVQCTQPLLIALRQQTILIQEPQWFAGTIYDNIALNAHNVALETILQHINTLGLTNKIMSFPEGLDTYVSHWKKQFTRSEITLIMILRAIIAKPLLIIIDQSLDDVDVPLLETVVALLLEIKKTTLIIATQRTDFPGISNRWTLS